MKLEILLLIVVLICHHAHGHGQMYNPTPWQAINDCNSANPGKCWFGIPDLPSNCTGHCRSNVGKNDFYSNFTVIPSKFGGKPAIPKEMLDEWLLPE